jgi:hypothetical protein
MSTDKTLADVQPGGRVRLGDQAELDRLEFQAWARSIGARVDADEHGNYVDANLNYAKLGWNAALSAQPSPGATALGLPIVVDPTVPPDTFEVRQPSRGGQGDALLELLVARWRDHAEEIGVIDNLLCQKIANCTMRHAAELKAALAARQPVELIAQKVGDYRVTVAEDAITVSKGRDIVFAYSAGDSEPIIDARQPVGEPVDDDWHLRGYAYASKQATTCAGCGKHKHTPLRIDAMGGHVCLTCIDQKLGALLGEFGYPPAQAVDLGTGVKAIADERERQLQVEGFSRDYDQQYREGELARAATAYVQLAAMDLQVGSRKHIASQEPPFFWPWAQEWWKPVDARRDLVRAGAMIAAQIDLIDGKAVGK